MGGVARIVVTDRTVHVQAGPRFLHIPLESIVRTGIGRRDGMYRAHHDLSILPPGSPTLTIHYTEKGKQQQIIVSSHDPEGLLAALHARPLVEARVELGEDALAERAVAVEPREESADDRRASRHIPR